MAITLKKATLVCLLLVTIFTLQVFSQEPSCEDSTYSQDDGTGIALCSRACPDAPRCLDVPARKKRAVSQTQTANGNGNTQTNNANGNTQTQTDEYDYDSEDTDGNNEGDYPDEDYEAPSMQSTVCLCKKKPYAFDSKDGLNTTCVEIKNKPTEEQMECVNACKSPEVAKANGPNNVTPYMCTTDTPEYDATSEGTGEEYDYDEDVQFCTCGPSESTNTKPVGGKPPPSAKATTTIKPVKVTTTKPNKKNPKPGKATKKPNKPKPTKKPKKNNKS